MITNSAPSARKFDCPVCGGSLEIRAAGYTTTVACRYCGSVIDVASPDARLIAQYHEAVAELAIPLGTRGTLGGAEWEAIGWQARADSSGAGWEEFLLFNPYAGYRWLVCDQGEWTFGRALVERPELLSAEVVRWQGQGWEIDDAPEPLTTVRVVGEFYWRVKVGEAVTGATYWSGKRQLSVERNQDEENWTLLDPVAADEVAQAFGLAPDGPAGGGTGPTAPRSGLFARPGTSPGDDRLFMLTALVTSLCAFMLTVFAGSSTFAAGQEIRVPVDAAANTITAITIGPITVARAYRPVVIRAQANDGFVNKWVDLDYHLVDRATHQAVGTSTTVDHYEGVDSDGNWSEGNYATTVMIGGVPRGTYDLVVEAEAHTWSQGAAAPTTETGSEWTTGAGPAIPITISASVGGMLWGNFWTVVVLVFGPALLLLWWHKRSSR